MTKNLPTDPASVEEMTGGYKVRHALSAEKKGLRQVGGVPGRNQAAG